MTTEVTLPQLGESVTEGTITGWLVSVGERVEADQPLFELSSDKIDTEVPAPASGVVTDIKVDVDETVEVGTVVAVIGGEEEAGGDGSAPAQADAGTAEQPAQAEAGGQPEPQPASEPAASQPAASQPAPEPAGQPAPSPAPGQGPAGDGHGSPPLASPLVRRIAAEKGIDPATVPGSGEGGRVTREDIEAAAGRAESAAPSGQATAPASAPASAPAGRRAPAPTSTGQREHTEDLSRIRQRIASKMMESLQSSAQLTTVQEVDVTPIMNARARIADTFKQHEGVSLSPFAFLCRAAVIAIRQHPKINAYADWEAAKVTYRDYVNLGVAVDTEKGLIVPNIKGADDLSLAGMARAIKEVADKARGAAQLEMDDIQGGTFTMTNTGSVGVLADTPILNYPEVGVLGTGAIRKKPAVIDVDGSDAIAVRHMMYLSLTYDHRLIDGADAARFVTDVKHVVESTDWDAEIGY